ncbi:hypothetical protein C8Q74DRAFT_1257380 [Fomes fomentarius]|nr:hypothetical protein C8Q74DRAFT_1257380 [Fomes fomentarius]
MHILGENTLENAKRLGYFDAQKLDPEIPVYSLEEYGQKKFYSLEDSGVYKF